MTTKQHKLKIDKLSVKYQKHTALENVSFEIPLEGITGIVGPNGAGKSTLLKSICGLIPKVSSQIFINDEPFSKYRKKIAYVPQKRELNLDFPILVEEVVALGALAKKRWYQRVNKKDYEKALFLLNQFGLSAITKKPISELSGGQQQRVFLARALMQDADILLLDEPFAGLDIISEQLLIEELKKLALSGMGILIVHHDLDSWKTYFDNLIILKNRLIASGEFKSTCTKENLFEAYGIRIKDFL
jgi:ABC-type Mn2+/Zn2+ transport system ATPase subunit